MIAGILFKYKLDLACLSAYLAESANVNFGKFHLAYKLFTKENEKTLSGECSMHLVGNTAKKKKNVVCLLMILRPSWFIELYGHCLLSSKCTEALNEISDFIKMEGDSLLRRASP